MALIKMATMLVKFHNLLEKVDFYDDDIADVNLNLK